MKLNKWIRARLIALAYLILITYLFLLPGSALPKENWFDVIYLDKWIHVFLFVILVFSWLRAFPASTARLYFIITSAIVYGILIELSQQLFVRNRSMDVFDILADTAGVFMGAAIWRVYKKNKPL